MRVRGLLLLCLGLWFPAACGETNSSSGSNSNWLSCSDDGDCDAGLRCWCGMCAASCTGPSECGGQSSCVAASDVSCEGTGTTSGSACLRACTANAECEAVRPGLTCVAGECVPSSARPPVELGPLSLALAVSHGCALRDGKVWCWGDNGLGQTGRSPAEMTDAAAEVQGLANVVEIAAGGSHTCARAADGGVFCWGGNQAGEIGAPSAPVLTCSSIVPDAGDRVDQPCQPVPSQVTQVSSATRIAVSPGRSCAVQANGTLECWGDIAELEPWFRSIVNASDVVLGTTACALLRDGSVSCSDGQSLPPALEGSMQRLWLSHGSPFACAIREGGRVDCWGDNSRGQRGIGMDAAAAFAADDEPAVTSGAVALAGGVGHVCALDEGGAVTCWGDNSAGQVGLAGDASPHCGGTPCQPTARVVDGIPRSTHIAASLSSTCAAAEDSTVYCWGTPVGNSFSTGSPVRVPGPWENGGAACADIQHTIVAALVAARQRPEIPSCVTDQDCTEVSLDAGCYRGCSSGPVSKGFGAELENALATATDVECPRAERLGCPLPAATCAAPVGELACNNGLCVRFDAAATGCSNPCECGVVRQAALRRITADACAGADLYVDDAIPCVGCGRTELHVLIGNRGAADFEGDVLLEPLSQGEAGANPLVLPAPLSKRLTIPSGFASLAFALPFESGAGAVRLQLTAPGTCTTQPEGFVVDVPRAAACSPE